MATVIFIDVDIVMVITIVIASSIVKVVVISTVVVNLKPCFQT